MIQGDVSDPQFCNDAVSRTVRELGKLDILVNNAAFQEHTSDIVELTDEHFDRTVKTNLYGYFYMSRAAVAHMEAGGSIIMTGSVTAIEGSKELARLLDDQGRHSRVCALALRAADRQRHPRQCDCAGPRLDASQSCRPAG